MQRIGFVRWGGAVCGGARAQAGWPAAAGRGVGALAIMLGGVLAATAAHAAAAPPLLTAEATIVPLSYTLPDAAPAPAGTMATAYRLGANDRVTITVYGEDELSREYVVGPTGTISLPLIGDITARGRTAEELRDEITRKLGNGFINNPTVTLMITAFRNFYILGEVNKPGEYAYESGLTVTEAVAEAAGFTYRAARRYAFIRHEGEPTERRVAITPDLSVAPGDTIRLGERYF